jgi:sortase A
MNIYKKEESNNIIIKNDIKDSINTINLGNIEIPNIKLKSDIIEGTTLENLNQNKVGHIIESSLSFRETIILAGHNDTVFKNLYKLKRNDEIYLTIYDTKEIYQVLYNIEIDENDYTYFKKEENKLILITCTKDKNKRRIIIAKRKI